MTPDEVGRAFAKAMAERPMRQDPKGRPVLPHGVKPKSDRRKR